MFFLEVKMETKYDFNLVEKGKYEFWLNNKTFLAGNDKSKRPFAIVIPPPNVTGNLHIGHAWDTTLQDIIIRYKKLCGFDALWVPGMDHAGIATQAKVDEKLSKMGINPRTLSREDWLKYAWDWKEEYANNIHKQWAKLGLALDYSRERFTLDEGLSKAVRKVFVDLYNKGLIYRGYRIINWDPKAQTALSNEEVIYKDVKGYFYHLKYIIEGTDKYLDVATTRPETLFGDTAVAVNPSDERYKDLIGKNVVLPIVGRLIPIIGDEHADPEFGTGCVKITPAHDPNDYEVGKRHNLKEIICINPDATMNENAGIYQGLSREEAREKLVSDLEKNGLLLSKEEITHNVGHSERTGVMIEPYLSSQWFVKMRPLADRVLENQKNKDTKVNFVPKRYEKTMNHWMEITYDWCISRQLWWGHRIPAWYKGDEIYVGENAPTGEGWVQDPDVLDTWFSSALWPFSTLGWPNKTDDLDRYFPNDVLVTGYDIIPFWVNRMTFQSLEFMNERPFKDCLIHGLIRDKQGRKMSKSLGNGVNPIDVIDKYGCDSLRLFLTTNSAPGMDLRYDEEKVASSWNFINKLWNASRYVIMNTNNLNDNNYKEYNNYDKWILTKYNNVIKQVTKYMDKYEFHNAFNTLYSFIWDDYCSSYIEISKIYLNDTSKSVLLNILTGIIKMLHPFIPFVTEEIYQNLPFKESKSIMESSYPVYNKKEVYDILETTEILNDITSLRNFKAENNIINSDAVKIEYLFDEKLYDGLIKFKNKVDNIEDSIKYESKYAILYFEVKNKVSEEDIQKEIEELEKSINKRKNLLSNENFVKKAPENIVANEKQKLIEEEEKLSKLKN
ncbi:MAG: valine--tRNA ligase [Bacilli bacterium]|nr:valine--tRNA ligase [Bacilli bacterium]MDY4619572.1 valine--tRNA ligase [Bacilli bacterium]